MNGQGGRQNRPSRHNPQTENRSQTQSAPGTIAGFGGCFLLVARIFYSNFGWVWAIFTLKTAIINI